ncbi:hypothetical protein TNCV_345921 [Trichonephila clavipes]|nr:hypothetical protein TNCV_345921 [Trichonephila clavipes]
MAKGVKLQSRAERFVQLERSQPPLISSWGGFESQRSVTFRSACRKFHFRRFWIIRGCPLRPPKEKISLPFLQQIGICRWIILFTGWLKNSRTCGHFEADD